MQGITLLQELSGIQILLLYPAAHNIIKVDAAYFLGLLYWEYQLIFPSFTWLIS
jgi:hypothetical protein